MARRKQIKGSLPITFYNLGSSDAQQIDLTRETLYTRMQNRLAELAIKIPVFLVNEAQMDAVAPPALQRGLNKDAVQRRLREAQAQIEARRESERRGEEEINPIERAWDELQRGEWSDKPDSLAPWTRFIPVGLYFGRHSTKPEFTKLNSRGTPQTVPDAVDAYQSANTPLIFICPERVMDWANRVNVDPNLVFDKVLYHELGHAYMDTADTPSESVYDTAWGRVIEESFANSIAFSQFRGIEARYVQRLIATQPAEYQGYLLVNQLHPWQLISGNDLYFESYHEFELFWYPEIGRLRFLLPRDRWGTWTEKDTNDSWRLGSWRWYKAHHRHSTREEMEIRTHFWQHLAAQVVMHL
ncbi:MAG: hypothetical protein D6697_00590 [Armatimonadetes bacterium]|nr:MAG: hypothetical protein D6697_00590 [Armatimonadota bacterium]